MVMSTLIQECGKIRKFRRLINDHLRSVRTALVFLALTGMGCGSGTSADRSIDWESGQLGAPDLPFMEFQTYEIQEDSASVQLWIGIRPESLVFIRVNDGFEAIVELEFRVSSKENRTPSLERFWTEKVRVATYEETQTSRQITLSRKIDVSTGEYQVTLTLRDGTTGKGITRSRFLSVVRNDGETLHASEMQILQGESIERNRPVLGPYAVASKGRLFASFHVLGVPQDGSFLSDISVLLVGWDSTIAAPPYAFNPLRGSLEHTGLDPESVDTVQALHLEPAPSTVTWELSIDRPGVYRIIARNRVLLDGGHSKTILVQRPLVLMPQGFPRPSTLEELIQPVRYLLKDDERDELASLSDQGDRREWLEQFWRERGENEQQSEEILEHYYSRVEEANEFFSSFKPGWQTDRGMIYIVFGPPLSVRQHLNVELWSYAHTGEDPSRTFEFRKVPLDGELDLFDHFVLERQPYYDSPWMIAVDRWRYGIGY